MLQTFLQFFIESKVCQLVTDTLDFYNILVATQSRPRAIQCSVIFVNGNWNWNGNVLQNGNEIQT